MPKIRFLRDYVVKKPGGNVYKLGDVVEVSEGGAQHFIRRHAAELFTEPPVKPKPKAKAKKAEDDQPSEPDAL